MTNKNTREVQVMVINENEVLLGFGTIEDVNEDKLFVALKKSNTSDECVNVAQKICEEITFENKTRADFIIPDERDVTDESEDMFGIDNENLVAIRLLNGKPICTILEMYYINDDDCFGNYPKLIEKGECTKIDNGVVVQDDFEC